MPENQRLDRRLQKLPTTIWSKITTIEELKGRWIAGAKLSPQVLNRLKRSVLITSTGASTRIEGARLSDEDVEKLIRGINIQKFTDRDKQEVKGYYELLENVFNSFLPAKALASPEPPAERGSASAGQNIRLNESTIKHFHKELLKYVKKDEKHLGEYKKQENKVYMVDAAGQSLGILFDTTAAYLTPKEMQELVAWTESALEEKRYHPLLVVGNFLVEFLQIHPFLDGNGRLSRVLTNFLLLKAGYLYMPYVSHEKLVEDNKPEYYLALRKSQKTLKSEKEDITSWLDFFLTIFLKQSEMALELLSQENIERLLTPKQRAVWEYIEKTSGTTPREIAEKTGVAYATVRQTLDKLLRLKKIERVGQGRSTSYRKL